MLARDSLKQSLRLGQLRWSGVLPVDGVSGERRWRFSEVGGEDVKTVGAALLGLLEQNTSICV